MANPLLITVCLCVGTYFICGIPFGLIITSLMTHTDIRSMGSGNIGSTNVGRSVGKVAAALTLLADTCKAMICSIAARELVTATLAATNRAATMPDGTWGWIGGMVVLAAIVGHVFSPYLHFAGGKGIAAGFGAIIGYAPLVAVGLLVVFLGLVLTTKLVSAGSVAAAVSMPFWMAVLYHALLHVLISVALASCIVIWAHRSNIVKLLHGEEKQFSFRSSCKDK
ncbi:glycerol-3-phosphate 1-O-acyltransferase PlsY [Atopobium fossor]|uniref:glycerol-3-phosphate 1-O-acyltransferase PlsY n=1 Tax=Atopobium fossor TaxID=39487 RepID=UPI0003F89C94|nr:glycerol-3-phosphate 1-O-acyltransferase PlsY [Atopobium fossor]